MSKSKTQKKEEKNETKRQKRATEWGEANQDPDLGAFLGYFMFWFPKFYSNPTHTPKMVEHDFWPWYRATKMFAVYCRCAATRIAGARNSRYATADSDAIAKLWGNNLRSLMILAGYEDKLYGRIKLPINRGHMLDTKSLLAVLGWSTHYTKETRRNGNVSWASENWNITDQWGTKVGEFTSMHMVRRHLVDKGIITSAQDRVNRCLGMH